MTDQTAVSGSDANSETPSDAHPDFVALRAGRTVGRYEIVSVLGQGSFGITYSARDSQLDRNVALKEYLPASLAVRSDGTTVRPRSTLTAADFTWGRERFVAEGRTIASLHDAPGIVRVFDFLEANGTAYIVMELVRGQTLDARLREDGPLGYAAVRQILGPLLSGLEQVHATGFLHRDIKPGNILIDQRGNPTLIDFGASRAAMAGRTTAMTAVFTPGYAAVEQFTSAKQGPWTDIYGVAATLHHAITGEPLPSSIDRMLDDTRVPLVQRAPAGFPRPLLAGIDAGLAVRVVDRPQSIADWRAALDGDSGSSDHATVVLPKARRQATRASSASPAKRRPLVWAGAAVVAVAILAGVGYAGFAPRSIEQVVLSEQERAEQDVRRAREQLAAAEQVVRRQAEEAARAVAEAEARSKAAAEAAERQRAEEDARRQAAVQNEQQRRDAEAARQKAAADEQQRQAAEAEQARQKAAADAAERQRALEEVQKAREAVAAAEAARKQAEDESTRLKAEAETRRQAEAAAAKAAADVEAKRLADEAAAKAQADSQQAAEAAAAAEKKAAETAETALRLSQTDRQRIQVALTSLGFDTRGADGSFGPRSRDMVAAWQKARNQPATGFLSGAQNQALLREAAPALSKFEEEQKKKDEEEKKKAEDAKKKAEEEAKARAATPAPAAPQAAAAAPTQPNGVVDGTYAGTLSISGFREYGSDLRLTVRMANGAGSGTATNPSCGNHPMSLRVDGSGNVTGEMQLTAGLQCDVLGGKLSGRVVNGREIALEMSGTTTRVRGRGQLRLAP